MTSSTLYDGTVPSSVSGSGRTGDPSQDRWSSVFSFLRGLADGWQAYRRWQDLDAMSDRQLGRIDLDRRDIAHAAVFGPQATGNR